VTKIGLWGISRAGWIAPLAMAQHPGIGFWISVSGTDDKENFPYFIESNFRIEGRSEVQIRRVAEADQLVSEVMNVRGYPVGDFEQRAADVSVDHPQVVTHYRAAHAVAVRSDQDANTEDLRQAVIHYRALFEDLLETREPVGV
jgi:hypothetical protein